MWTLMHEGGWPMWMIVAFGVIALGAAARFALRPERRQRGFIISMSAATLFSIFVGTCADLAAVGHSVGEQWSDLISNPNHAPARMWSEGFAESMSPGIMGFVMLSLVAMLYAVGHARLEPPAS